MALGLALVVAVLSMPGPAPLWAQEPETFSISGNAVNGTAGGSVPGNLPVDLHVIDGVAGRVATYNATTDEEGAFTFEGITPIPGGSYVLVMDFDGMRYSSLLEGNDVGSPVVLEVFETTDDLAVVEIQRQAMIIADVDQTNREIRALEVLSLENTSDRTLLPELTNITSPTDINFLRFSLPEGASELSVQSTLPGGDTIPMGTGFAVTAPGAARGAAGYLHLQIPLPRRLRQLQPAVDSRGRPVPGAGPGILVPNPGQPAGGQAPR